MPLRPVAGDLRGLLKVEHPLPKEGLLAAPHRPHHPGRERVATDCSNQGKPATMPIRLQVTAVARPVVSKQPRASVTSAGALCTRGLVIVATVSWRLRNSVTMEILSLAMVAAPIASGKTDSAATHTSRVRRSATTVIYWPKTVAIRPVTRRKLEWERANARICTRRPVARRPLEKNAGFVRSRIPRPLLCALLE